MMGTEHARTSQPGAATVQATEGQLTPLAPAFWESWQVREAAATSPGAVVSLVRRAYGLRQDELGARAGFSQSTISRLESGGNLAYDMRVLRALQRLLGVPPGLLGLAGQPVAKAGTDVEPAPARVDHPIPAPEAPALHDLCPAATAFGVGLAADACLTGLSLGPELVSQLLVARKVLNDAHSWRRSNALLLGVRQLYEIANGLRRSATQGEIRNRLLFVSAVYAEFYGWLQEENGELRKAGHWTGRALQQAQAAEDRNMVAYAYTRMSELAEADGDADRVIGLAGAALREDGDNPRVRAFALCQRARGNALRHEETSCLTAMDEALELVDGAGREHGEEYVVGDWITRYHIATERAGRLLELGRISDALDAYAQVRAHWNQICPWLQGLHLAKIAVAQASRGELDAAAATGFEAFLVADSTGSPFVSSELRRLEPWAGVGPMAEICDAVRSMH